MPQCGDEPPAEREVTGLFHMMVLVDEAGDRVQPLILGLQSVVVINDLFKYQDSGEKEKVFDISFGSISKFQLTRAVYGRIARTEAAEVDAVLVLLVDKMVQVWS